VGCRHRVVGAVCCAVVPVSVLGLLYRTVYVFWQHGGAALINCRVNLVVPFARELKHLTICRPLRRFIVSCLTALIFSLALQSIGTRTAFTPHQDTVLRRITTFRLTADRIYDGGYYYYYYYYYMLLTWPSRSKLSSNCINVN
jgi:hypothetical protein